MRSSAALAEVVGHGLHLVLLGAGFVTVAALLWVSRPRRTAGTSRDPQARVQD